jgi:hypothetical protein
MVPVYLPTKTKVPTKIIATRKLSWLDHAEKKFEDALVTYANCNYQLLSASGEIQMYLAIMAYYGMFE